MKKFFAILLALVMVLSLAACGGDSGGSAKTDDTAKTDDAAKTDAAEPAASGDESYNISVILKTNASEYWNYVEAGAKKYMEDNPNVKVEIKGPPSETSYDEQQNMIETDMSNADIDGYVIAPLQADMVANMIKGQTKPVIALDTRIVAPEIRTFVGTGNEAAAKQGGIAAVALAKERGWTEIKCIEIAGVQGDSTNEDRMNGYKAGVEEAGGDFLEDEIQYANAVADQAVTCMEAIMQNHPEGLAIICANNDDMAMAAARIAAGNEAYKNTVFLGFDGQVTTCESILNGEQTMTVAQHGYEMGYEAVSAAVRAIQGEELPEFIDSGADVIDASNAQERIDTLKGYLA